MDRYIQRIEFKVREDEKKGLRKIAEIEGETMSNLLRRMIRKEILKKNLCRQFHSLQSDQSRADMNSNRGGTDEGN